MRSRKIIIIYALIVVLLLFTGAMYYYKNQSDVGIRTGLVGDAVCGNLPVDEERDACCAEAHKSEATIECLGDWIFIEEESICKYVCGGRNSWDDPSTKCFRADGEWKEFSNGCVDSCDLARNPETILCTAALTDGCDCGPDRCWNGQSCEDN